MKTKTDNFLAWMWAWQPSLHFCQRARSLARRERKPLWMGCCPACRLEPRSSETWTGPALSGCLTRPGATARAPESASTTRHAPVAVSARLAIADAANSMMRGGDSAHHDEGKRDGVQAMRDHEQHRTSSSNGYHMPASHARPPTSTTLSAHTEA